MLTLLILAPIFLVVLLVSIVFRILFSPFRYARREFMGNGFGYGRGFGYGNRFGCRHRHGFGGGLFTILALVALDRLFTRRF